MLDAKEVSSKSSIHSVSLSWIISNVLKTYLIKELRGLRFYFISSFSFLSFFIGFNN